MMSLQNTGSKAQCKPVGSQRRRGGFTLIELMVVIAILLILAVITLAVTSNVKQRAQINKTKTTLTILQGLMEDYERDTGVQLPVGADDTKDYVTTLSNYPKTKNAIAKLIAENSGVVNDGFGKPIKIVTAPKRGFISMGPAGTGGSDTINSWDPQ